MAKQASKGNIDYSQIETPEGQAELRELAENYPNVVARRRALMRGLPLDPQPLLEP